MKTKLDLTSFVKINEDFPPVRYRPGSDSPEYLAAIKAKEDREKEDQLRKKRLNASEELINLQNTLKQFERFKEAYQRSGHEIPHREGTLTFAADTPIVKAIYSIEAELVKEYEKLKFEHIQNGLVQPLEEPLT